MITLLSVNSHSVAVCLNSILIHTVKYVTTGDFTQLSSFLALSALQCPHTNVSSTSPSVCLQLTSFQYHCQSQGNPSQLHIFYSPSALLTNSAPTSQINFFSFCPRIFIPSVCQLELTSDAFSTFCNTPNLIWLHSTPTHQQRSLLLHEFLLLLFLCSQSSHLFL